MQKTYNVIADHDTMRLDRWLRKNIDNLPQGLIEKFLRNGNIKVNKRKIKSSYKVREDDRISLFNVNIEKQNRKNINYIPSKKILTEIENEIIFDNEDYIVINKISGLPTQKGTKSNKNVIDIFRKSIFFSNSEPYAVHRLDKDTSGVLIIGKNRKTAQLFTSLFRLRKIYKTYIAVCEGEFTNNKGLLEHNLVRYDGYKKISEKAITYYRVISKNSKYSFVEFKPITGRKHQLRKQASLISHSIIGDKKYSLKSNKFKNLFLHAYSLKFMINNKKYNYHAHLPDYFQKFLKSNKFNYSNYK